ncbi:MAG: hypothetical protein H6621_05540 [Halobacteriovoraceae bacterium]|nr:hypothetical protein [Halobacteriovoraceae bacterium]
MKIDIREKIQREEASNIGFSVAMISWGMLFASLFLAYALYRFKETAWPPMGFEKVSLVWPTTSTIIIFLSSCTYYLYQKSYFMKQVKSTKFFYSVTVLFASLFLVSQKMLWATLHDSGLYTSSGIFASILHGFTWVHAGHVGIGILAILFVIPSVKTQNIGNEKFRIRMANVGKFWHFLGIVWFLMYLTMFVL